MITAVTIFLLVVISVFLLVGCWRGYATYPCQIRDLEILVSSVRESREGYKEDRNTIGHKWLSRLREFAEKHVLLAQNGEWLVHLTECPNQPGTCQMFADKEDAIQAVLDHYGQDFRV